MSDVTRDDLLAMDTRALARVLEAGHPIDPASLDDTEYRGTSLGLPHFVEKLTWKKFMKTFHRDPETGHLRGWNVRLEQNELDAPCIPLEKRGERFTFGHYRVVEAAGVKMPWKAGFGLLIDYGQGGNAALDPMRRVRDPLVSLRAGGADFLLGSSYVDLGLTRTRTPAYFCLERVGPLSHVVAPPRAPRTQG